MPAPRFASNAFLEINNTGAVPPIGPCGVSAGAAPR